MTDPEQPPSKEDITLVFAVIFGIVIGYLIATINVQVLSEIQR